MAFFTVSNYGVLYPVFDYKSRTLRDAITTGDYYTIHGANIFSEGNPEAVRFVDMILGDDYYGQNHDYRWYCNDGVYGWAIEGNVYGVNSYCSAFINPRSSNLGIKEYNTKTIPDYYESIYRYGSRNTQI